jgi:hypothetical protein
VDAPAERLARAENVGSNICVSVCCLMWGRTFVDSWLVFPAPLEVRSARKCAEVRGSARKCAEVRGKVFNCFGRQLARGPGVWALCI